MAAQCIFCGAPCRTIKVQEDGKNVRTYFECTSSSCGATF